MSSFSGTLAHCWPGAKRRTWLRRSYLPLDVHIDSTFMLGILLIYVFAFGLKWFRSGAYERGSARPELGVHQERD